MHTSYQIRVCVDHVVKTVKEQEFIEAASRIRSFNVTSRPGIPISPIEICLIEDSLLLVLRVRQSDDKPGELGTR